MNDLASLYIKVDSSGVVTASTDLDKLSASAKKTEEATKQTTKATDAANSKFEKLMTSLRGTNGATQQAAASFGKINSALVGLGAVALAVAKSIQYIPMAAQAKQIESSFKIMAEASRVSANAMIANMEWATRGTVDSSKLMEKAVKLMAMGYDSKQIERFTQNVVAASQVAGISVNDAYEKMADAIASKMPRALIQLGALTKTQMNIVNRAVSSGVDEMALYELAMANLELRTLQLKGTQDTATISIQRFQAQTQQTKEFIGGAFLRAIQFVYGIFQGFASAVLMLAAAFPYALAKMMEFQTFVKEKLGGKEEAENIRKQAAAVMQVANDFKGASEELAQKANDNIMASSDVGTRATKQEIENAQAKVAAAEKELKAKLDKIEADKKALKLAQELAKVTSDLQFKTDTSGMDDFEKELAKIARTYDELRKKFGNKPIFDSAQQSEENEVRLSARIEQIKKEAEIIQAVAKAEEDMAKDVDAGTKETLAGIKKKYEEEGQLLRDKLELYKDLTGFEDEYRNTQLEWIERIKQEEIKATGDVLAAEKHAAEQRAKIEYELFKKKTDYKAEVFGQLQSTFSSLASIYEDGSESAKRWEEAARAMEIAQKAVAVVQAVAAIATQGLGDPYTAFARIAAMAATMGALLATIGESVGGGGSSSAASISNPAMGNSTVLGAAYGTGSESIANSYELLQDTYDLEDVKLTKIYNELKSLNSNITGLVSGILRTGTLNVSASSGSWYDQMSMGVGSGLGFFSDPLTGSIGLLLNNMSTEDQGKLASKLVAWGSADPFTAMTHELLEKITGGKFAENVGNFLSGVFGGETERSVTSAGVQLNKTTLRQILTGGISAKKYADITQTTDGGWFHSDKTSSWTQYETIDSNVSSLFSKIYQNLSNTLIGLAEGLGTNVDAVLNYSFDTLKLNLQGKTGDEISKALSEAFSAVGDTAVEALFGSIISQYQKVNEGLLETATRLITDKESILHILEYTNQSFEGTTSELIKFSESLITVAGSLETLTDAFNTYYDAFFSDAEKQADLKSSLSTALGGYGYDLPGTRSGYRDIVESLDIASEAGRTAYTALMLLADSADAYYSYLEDAKSAIKESDYATRTDYLRAVNGYAGGGDFGGGWRIVGEGGPELEYTGPSHIYSNSQSKNILNFTELAAEIKAMRNEMRAGNIAIAKNTRKAAIVLDKMDGIGMPAARGW